MTQPEFMPSRAPPSADPNGTGPDAPGSGWGRRCAHLTPGRFAGAPNTLRAPADGACFGSVESGRSIEGTAPPQTLWSELAARDVMMGPPVCVEPSTTIRDLARVLEINRVSAVPVVDQVGVYIGMVSKADLILACVEGRADIPPEYVFRVLAEPGGGDTRGGVMVESLACVEDFMREAAVAVSPDAPLGEIARRMSAANAGRMVVVDVMGAPVGIITSQRLLGLWPL
jgi:CBS domain-containing protein